MELDVLILLAFAGLFLIIDIAMLVRMIYLLKKNRNGTVENLGNKLNPYLYMTGIISVLMAMCMILVTIIK